MFIRFLRFLRQVWESFRFAWQALRSNLLRTTLSLLGVTIGIFAIITVFSIVDALNRSVRSAMSFIGEDVMYIQKFPWRFGDPTYPWWKYMARPTNTINEFKFLEKNLDNAEAVALITGKSQITVKYQSYSYTDTFLNGVSLDYIKITGFEVANGRYFTTAEIDNAREVCLVGDEVANNLFYNTDPVGKIIKVKGRPFAVIGVLKKEGSNIFGESSNDKRVIIPYGAFGKMYRIGFKGVDPLIALKGKKSDPGLFELEGEVTGLMRTKRSLKPFQEDNFALNRTELFTEFLNAIYFSLWIGGMIIGGFSILVGAFGIANIMFVSVKERTNLIGIQKSLGAKNYFILFQFLFEALLLSLVGGLFGLFLVYLISFIPLGSLELILSTENTIIGLGISSVVGMLAGVIPAYSAAIMDPVEAIRSK
ncbi:MAG: ABC transporter permease [Microscillaceae bacterium]|jgi:putative ABC transport system permease protein|nr:ABC transporter permease [Microscillaceae bacterium]